MNLAAETNAISPSAEEVGEAEIVERIFDAVMERRLPPGTKLSEAALCQAFGVGRMRIRRVLLLLASREVIELRSNRGAFIASPTIQQAHEVFEARLAFEPNVARLVAQRANEADLAKLSQELALEAEALRTGNRREAIRLSGQFHVRIAEVAGNGVLLRMIRELITRTSLILGIYGEPGTDSCRDHDHQSLLDAFSNHDPERAAQVMSEHLKDIESHMVLSGDLSANVDIVRMFSDAD